MRPNFGAGWAGSGHTLSTLRPYSRLPGRKTRFRLLARLYRVGSMAHWVPPKGFELFPTSLLLSQAFPGASARRSDPPNVTMRATLHTPVPLTVAFPTEARTSGSSQVTQERATMTGNRRKGTKAGTGAPWEET